MFTCSCSLLPGRPPALKGGSRTVGMRGFHQQGQRFRSSGSLAMLTKCSQCAHCLLGDAYSMLTAGSLAMRWSRVDDELYVCSDTRDLQILKLRLTPLQQSKPPLLNYARQLAEAGGGLVRVIGQILRRFVMRVSTQQPEVGWLCGRLCCEGHLAQHCGRQSFLSGELAVGWSNC